MINFNKVYFSYKKEKVLENFNYKFSNNGLYAIIGESGCGKTTLLNLIGGLLKPANGFITYSDDIKNISDSTAYIFQDNNLFDNLTVYENIKLLTSFKIENINDQQIDYLLEKLGVLKYKEKLVSKLSGGERQRISIVIALLIDKKVIVADEPLASLDYTNSKIILDFFKEISKNKLIIFSSHNVDILKDYCDEIIDLEHGKFDNYNVEELSLPTNKGKNLSFKKFVFTHNKILAKKSFIKIVAAIFLSFCIAILSIMFSMTQISFDKILLDELKKESESPVIITQNSDDIETRNNVKQYLDNNQFKYLEGISLRNELGFSSLKMNKNIFVEFNNELDDFEIVMTDEVFDEYRNFGIISQNNTIENSEGLIYQTETLDCNNNPFNMKIKKIIDTRKRAKFENGIYHLGSWGTYDTRVQLNQYTYSILESGDLLHDDNLSIVLVNANYEYGKYDRCKEVKYSFKENLSENEIVLTNKSLEVIEFINGKTYNVGDEVVLTEWVKESKKYVITKIDESDDEILYFSTRTIVDDKIKKIDKRINFYEIIDYEPESIIEMKKNLSPYLFSFSGSNMHSEELNVIFEGASDSFDYYSSLRAWLKMSTIVLIAFVVLTLLFSTYYVLATYSINKNKFMILKIYGMKKNNELFLLEYDLLILLLISTFFGTILYALFNFGLNNYFTDITGVDKIYNLFIVANELLSFIIILAFMSFLFFICYIISSNKRLKTHIGN